MSLANARDPWRDRIAMTYSGFEICMSLANARDPKQDAIAISYHKREISVSLANATVQLHDQIAMITPGRRSSGKSQRPVAGWYCNNLQRDGDISVPGKCQSALAGSNCND